MDDFDERRADGRSLNPDRRHRHGDHRHRDNADGHRRRSPSPPRKRRRSHSPDREHSHRSRRDDRGDRHHSHRHRKAPVAVPAASLPFDARQLSKRDLPIFEPLLADFLFIQKQKDLYEMDDREVKGRWKSFVGKWNRGELAEGWYDPETFARVKTRADEMGLGRREEAMEESEDGAHDRRMGDKDNDQEEAQPPRKDVDDDDDEDYGPVLPGTRAGRMSGPGIPSRQDLALRDEQRAEDRDDSLNSLRLARKADRALQKERLDDLTPRAAAGTRERQLEKKQLLNEKLRSFRDRSPGATAEVAEGELMGGAGDELEELKREKKKQERKKSEREVRREEMERARREEVEERRRRWKEREEGTVEGLRELARQRFGGS